MIVEHGQHIGEDVVVALGRGGGNGEVDAVVLAQRVEGSACAGEVLVLVQSVQRPGVGG